MKKATGNMYPFVTHTWNPVRGECPYCCIYCYTSRWGKLPPLHLDEKVLNENLRENNYIFICSGCDLFNPIIPDEWISKVILHTKKYNNTYLLHTKNPERALLWEQNITDNHILCVTIETHFECLYRDWSMSRAPQISKRIQALKKWNHRKMITIEPILKFDPSFAEKLLLCKPEQVNIGANSGKLRLPEPNAQEIESLIYKLECNTKVVLKKNLKRIYPGGIYG
jgi:DNA repair photolyase